MFSNFVEYGMKWIWILVCKQYRGSIKTLPMVSASDISFASCENRWRFTWNKIWLFLVSYSETKLLFSSQMWFTTCICQHQAVSKDGITWFLQWLWTWVRKTRYSVPTCVTLAAHSAAALQSEKKAIHILQYFLFY